MNACDILRASTQRSLLDRKKGEPTGSLFIALKFYCGVIANATPQPKCWLHEPTVEPPVVAVP